MADDDRPHHHIDHGSSYYGPIVVIDEPCDDNHPDHNVDAAVVVIALDDYRQLVAAARDRHPTNHQHGGIDPAAYIAGLEYNDSIPARDTTDS